MIRRRVIPALLLALAVAGSACGGAEGDVLVFAAASAGDVVRDLAPEAMALSVAASSTLARQIRQGAPADVFVSADARWADWLEAEGVEVIDRKTVARGRLVWVEPAGTPSRPTVAEAVGAAERVALGDPGHVPAGAYARDALTDLDLWESVEARVIPQADVRAALVAVETGAADAAVVYASDARVSDRVVVTADLPAARPVAYVALLLSPRGRAVFGALSPEADAWAERGFLAP